MLGYFNEDIFNMFKTELLKLNANKISLWMNSTIYLTWITSKSIRWNVFVANHVSEIQYHS